MLLTEQDITLENAYKKALAREQAADENKIFGGSISSSVYAVQKGGKQFTPQRGRISTPQRSAVVRNGSSKSTAPKPGNGDSSKTICKRCKLLVRSNKCYNNQCKTKCFNCSLIGHTSNDCRKPKIHSNSLEFDENKLCSFNLR